MKIGQCLCFETINIIGMILDEVCALTACLSLPNIVCVVLSGHYLN